MKAERSESQLTVSLTSDEIRAVQAGRTVGDRSNVILMDAKIEILPLGAIEPDDSAQYRFSDERLEMARTTPVKGKLFPNGDLQIFLPNIVLADVRVAERVVAKKDIQDQMQQGQIVDLWIPENGVRVAFGGSLKVIDITHL